MAIHAQPDDPRPVMRYADALADACRDFSTLELLPGLATELRPVPTCSDH